MRKLLFAFLSLSKYFRNLKRTVLGKTEDDMIKERIVSGRSWDDFCEQLKLAGTNLKYPGAPQDVFSQAEGIRYLTRLTRVSLEAFVEYADPSFPIFKRMVHETVKMGADNPDNYYFNAQISGTYEYRITGKRNTAHYIGFFTQNGNYGTTGGLTPCGVLEGVDLKLEADGSFEIIISKEPKGKNWLKLENETGLVMVRQTFYDRFKEVPAEIRIENLDGRKSPEPLSPKMLDDGLKMASMFVAGAPLLFARWAKGFRKHVNELPQFDPKISNAAGGDANIIYYHSYWNLKPDQALVIDVKPPACDSWNFQLNNYWMESLDYQHYNISINKHSAVYEADGTVRIAVSHKDPGLPNWIETAHHREGTMCWRWYRIHQDSQDVQPACRIVKKVQ